MTDKERDQYVAIKRLSYRAEQGAITNEQFGVAVLIVFNPYWAPEQFNTDLATWQAAMTEVQSVLS